MIGGLTVIVDQITKALVVSSFAPGASRPLLPFLHLTYVQNTGAAFGIFKGQQAWFIVSSMAVIGWIAWEWLTRPAPKPAILWGTALVFGGAIGNLIDRIRLSYVIDFIDLRVWPVFNVGDSAITVGVTLIILHAFLHPRSGP